MPNNIQTFFLPISMIQSLCQKILSSFIDKFERDAGPNTDDNENEIEVEINFKEKISILSNWMI